MGTGYIYDESYFWHDNGSGTIYLTSGGYLEKDVFVEDPLTKRRINNLLHRCGLMKELDQIEPRMASREEIEYFHASEYIDKVKHLSENNGGDAGDHAIVGRGSYDIARLSVGGAITAVDAVMKGDVKNVYALTRPPGHHAERDFGIGFCIFNNVVIAARHAQKTYGLKKILVLDWDVHHGNGTEQAFYHDPDVVFISIHQDLSFPNNTGYKEDVGAEDGEGYNVNIPLPPGTGDQGYIHAFKEIIVPIAKEFEPELILISAGQDPGMFDPLGRMMMTADGFGKIAEIMMGLAEELCDGKIVFCHEGGYSNGYVPFCTLRIIETLSGIQTDVVDPFAEGSQGYPDKLYGNQKDAINNIINVQQKYWTTLKEID